jgi:hypothetical protein
MGSSPDGFTYEMRGNGTVLIRHHGRLATTLRGSAAATFLVEVQQGHEQELMARVTGNYKRGNERVAKHHPRNRGRQG